MWHCVFLTVQKVSNLEVPWGRKVLINHAKHQPPPSQSQKFKMQLTEVWACFNHFYSPFVRWWLKIPRCCSIKICPKHFRGCVFYKMTFYGLGWKSPLSHHHLWGICLLYLGPNDQISKSKCLVKVNYKLWFQGELFNSCLGGGFK